MHALPAEATSLSLPELHDLLESYLDRNQPELVELQHERESRGSWRKSEGKGKREVEIEKTREQEVQEYKAGFGEFNRDLCTPFRPSPLNGWLERARLLQHARVRRWGNVQKG